ncbi:4-hydroxy-4-methyl-2-oxoglutarate aldolase [Novosphingobium fluoreni]|uniref:Putative 4-hydroxy-4-methyl-2-oxoglutarate aldolase n=1 Tax=Novosphingobium fluoreni TaxID=1391222 RepID=A0A7W6FZN4_9SPHN|nr:RraA family protein [Novosphingobium fluoreni]MBB3941310.1 4-hydroxy-4-methyl-2-oxoglutarate aldolase [Novosphingobium fluoreni]
MMEVMGGLDERLRGRLNNMTTALIADSIMELGHMPRVMDAAIRPVLPYSKMVGRALTVSLVSSPTPLTVGKLEYSGMMLVFEGFEAAGSGWIAVASPEIRECAVFGDGFSVWSRSLGITGLLTDGAARDTHEINGRNFPVFSRGLSPLGPYNLLKVSQVNVPVTVGGVEVRPGDVIAADHDGIIVFDVEWCEAIISQGAAHVAKAAGSQAALGAGGSIVDQHWSKPDS